MRLRRQSVWHMHLLPLMHYRHREWQQILLFIYATFAWLVVIDSMDYLQKNCFYFLFYNPVDYHLLATLAKILSSNFYCLNNKDTRIRVFNSLKLTVLYIHKTIEVISFFFLTIPETVAKFSGIITVCGQHCPLIHQQSCLAFGICWRACR